jgi:hypothetical protein
VDEPNYDDALMVNTETREMLEREHRHFLNEAIDQERRRCVGIVLAHYGTYKLAGRRDIAAALDLLATEIDEG